MAARIGVDVGGTNTDAVLIDGHDVLAWAKRPTSADVTSGIREALTALFADAPVAASDVRAVMLGTTHFTNAVIVRRGLARTAVLRLCLPATAALPPLVDWPDDLRAAIAAPSILLHGGYEFDGSLIEALDETEIAQAVEELRHENVEAAAVAGVFSPVDGAQERAVAAHVQAALPELSLTLSSEIGRIGLLERENAAVLNASLSGIARSVIGSLRAILQGLGLDCPLFVSQNDGTLMTAEFAQRYPVLTFASGPTNSMRGAALLSGLTDAIVIDIGGTSTDIGVLAAGFPREAGFEVSVGGVRTNFRMPDLLSLALGGGSLVSADGARVGPQSVGYGLTRRAVSFGGAELTATDVGIAAGLLQAGDPARAAGLPQGLVRQALATVRGLLEGGIDALKTSNAATPVIAVGGGSFLLPEGLAGVSQLVRPPHYQVANAVGAAIAQVSGEVDRIFPLEGRTREGILAEARAEAENRAVEAGAARNSLEIVEVEEIPVAYLPSSAVRVRVKAVGDLGQ
jgi:N-methylhydantoinase A/oxoprolinase/acetone carboxylase beta subunit